MTSDKLHAVASNALFGSDSEKRRADVMANNCKWPVDKIDRIHDALCPDICGTWQQRSADAVAEAQKARKQMDELHACLKEAMEWCKPCNYEHEPWLRWAKARDSYKPNGKDETPNGKQTKHKHKQKEEQT